MTDAESEPDVPSFEQVERRLKELLAELGPGDEPAAPEGRVIGDFQVVRSIGTGGMATVYEAVEAGLNRRVALKVLPSLLSLSPRAIETFHREALALGRQHHPGIVAVHRVGEVDGVHFIAEELVGDGHTLADELDSWRSSATRPPGYLREVAGWIAEVAEAVAHAHAHAVVHRDLKPSNLLLTADRHIRVTDFGLALVGTSLGAGGAPGLVGTPTYTSPEQAACDGREIDERADVFALGITLYECLTLERPFTGTTAAEVLRAVRFAEPPDPRELNPRVSRDLAVICLKALEKDPARRYQTMAAMAADLRRLLAGEAIRARPVGRLVRGMKFLRRHRLRSAAFASVAVAVASVAILLLVLRGRDDAVLRTARERYDALERVLSWPGRIDPTPPWQWCRDIAPDLPAWRMLAALDAIKSDDLETAATHLQTLLETPDLLGESVEDACFLAAVVARRRAADPRHATQSAALLVQADAWSRHAAGGNHPPGRGLVLHDPGVAVRANERLATALSISGEHELAHMYRGVASCDQLGPGGRAREFDAAVEDLEQLLAHSADHPVGLTCLARVLAYRALAYDWVELTAEAERLALRAIERGAPRRNGLDDVTLGYVGLLRGDAAQAASAFRRGVEHAVGERARDEARAGLVEALMLGGDLAAAREAIATDDPGVLQSLAAVELGLREGDLAAAMRYIERANSPPDVVFSGSQAQLIATSQLAAARVHAARGDPVETHRALDRLRSVARYAPRDLGCAVFLILSLPEEWLVDQGFVDLAWQLARYANAEAHATLHTSPIALAALGAAHGLRGDPDRAAELIAQASAARARSWPSSVERRHFEEARDQCALALVWVRAGREDLARGALAIARQAEERANGPAAEGSIAGLLRAAARRAVGDG